jgi:transposase
MRRWSAGCSPAGYNPPRSKPLPDWAHVHAELRRARVMLALLWQDYRGEHPDGYGYSRFCDLYGEWRRGVTATISQTHTAGEKLLDSPATHAGVRSGHRGDARHQDLRRGLGGIKYTYAEERCADPRMTSPDCLLRRTVARTSRLAPSVCLI